MDREPELSKHQSAGNRYNRERALELDEIQLEQDPMMESAGRVNLKRAQTYNTNTGEGKPNRISQYKKVTQVEYKPQGSSSTNLGKQDNMEMDDDSFGNSPRLRTGNPDADMKQAVMNMHETQEVYQLVKEFEKCFCGAKKKVNECDLVTLESELTIQALKMQYRIIQELMFEENPNFDVEKMEYKIENMLVKVKTTNQEYNKFKGEFFAVNEPVINKDLLQFKLERIQRYHEKQKIMMDKLPDQESGLQENFVNLQSIKQKFEIFQKQIFEKKHQDTQILVKDTAQLIQKIELAQVQYIDQLNKAKLELTFLIPQNKEQRLRLQQITGDIASIQKRLDNSKKVLSQAKIEQEQLEIKDKNNFASLKSMQPGDMLENIGQVRMLEHFVQSYNDFVVLNKKAKKLLDEDLTNVDYDLQKSLQDSKKYIDSVTSGRQEEYDDLLKQIQKVAKKVNDDANQQDSRLVSFENQMIIPNEGKVSVIAVPDMLFLKQEVARNKYSIQSCKSEIEEILADSQDMIKEKQRDSNIEVEDLQQMRQNLRALQKIEVTDLTRIIRNIDQLEGFILKNLKNTLNDDNKKSQGQISKMKKNYEDLQKAIDALNLKLVKVNGEVMRLKETFTNDDMERINEIALKCDDKLNDCDKNINGDKNSLEQDPTKSNSLQARKKVIIAAINKMVNIFNENNKLIKESNKQQKTEREMADLINKNTEIQEDCKKIEEKISSAKEFIAEIDEVLDEIIDPGITEIKEKFSERNQAIDECDELFDKANAQIDRLGNILEQQQDKVKDIIARLDTVNPINNPSPKDKIDNGFLKDVQEKLEAAYQLQDQLEKMKESLGATRDNLIEVVQPLNELDERNVKQAEIDDILNELDALNEALMSQEKSILPKGNEIDYLEKDVMDMLEKDKGNKINDTEDKLGALDDLIKDMGKNKNDALDKLAQLKDAIQDAKQASKNDPALKEKIREMEEEARQIEKEINDLDRKIDEMKKKKSEQEKLLEEMKQNPEKFKPSQIEALLATLDELIDKAEMGNDKLRNQIIPALDEMIKELDDLVGQSQEKDELKHQIGVLEKDIGENLEKYNELMGALPGLVGQMLNCYKECLADSTPDKTADYFEEKDHIEGSVKDLDEIKGNLEKIDKTFKKKNDDLQAALQAARSGSSNIPDLIRICENLKTYHLEIEAYLNDAYDQQDEVQRIKKDHGDVYIPINIRLRQQEIEALSDRIDRIYDEFAELKQADQDFEGDASIEAKIKKQIQLIDKNIQQAERDRKERIKFFTGLQRYTSRDFQNYGENYMIIISIREFRFQIIQYTIFLKTIEDMISELNTELIRQDMDNATKILSKKMQKLRQRLQEAKEDLEQIRNCGEEMDGNTTNNEEDEFIDALKDEMPDVFKNIDFNFDQLDEIDGLLQEVIRTKDIEKMQLLKKEVDDSNNKIEQSEGLVLKLENEIIEWNALRKLCTRDEELFEIETLLQDFDTDLKEEYGMMDKELKKNQAKNEKDGDPKGELEALRNGIISYSTEIQELMQQVMILRQERSSCYMEFDLDIPSAVKQERILRLQEYSKQEGKKIKIDMNVQSDKPTDIYYMITINCRYKMRIHSLLKELRTINQRRRELDDKYALLKRDLNAVKAVKQYKPVKGDKVDELFAYHMNKANLNLKVQRLAAGKYLFGSKQILAKIINGKLVIRVGGGYMSADEFIEQYGRIEMLKMMKADGDSEGFDMMSRGSMGREVSTGRGSRVIGMGEMKNMLRESLATNVKAYDTIDTKDHEKHVTKHGKGDTNFLRVEDSYESRDMLGGSISKKKYGLQSPAPVRSTKMVTSSSTATIVTSTKKLLTPQNNLRGLSKGLK